MDISYAQKLSGIEIGRLLPGSLPVAVSLFPQEVLTLEGGRLYYRIICLQGRLWITQENDSADYLLEAGEEFVISRDGAVVIQGLLPSRARIEPPEFVNRLTSL